MSDVFAVVILVMRALDMRCEGVEAVEDGALRMSGNFFSELRFLAPSGG